MKYSQEFINYANRINIEDALYGANMEKLVDLYQKIYSGDQIFDGVDDYSEIFNEKEDLKNLFKSVQNGDVSLKDSYLNYNNRGELVSFSNLHDKYSPIYVPDLVIELSNIQNENLLEEYNIYEIDFDDEDEVLYYAVRKHLADLSLNNFDKYQEIVESSLNTQFYEINLNNFDTIFQNATPSQIFSFTQELNQLGIDELKSSLRAPTNQLMYVVDGKLKVCNGSLDELDKSEIANNILKSDTLMQELKETGFDLKNIVSNQQRQTIGLGR